MAVFFNLRDDFEISVDFFLRLMCSSEQAFHDGDGARSDAAWRIQNRNATRVGSVTCQNAKKHHDGEDVLEEDEFEACAMEGMLMSMLEGQR